jgi:hypothetical protein
MLFESVSWPYVIYKIECNSPDIDLLFVGSTDNWKKTLKRHKDNSKREMVISKLNVAIRKHGGISNWTFNGLEVGTTCTHAEMKAREKFFCDELKPDLQPSYNFNIVKSDL